MAAGKYAVWLEADNLIRLECWAQSGLTDQQLAAEIGCSAATLRRWRKQYTAIDAAIRKGRDAVNRKVENALLKRALGFTYQEKTVEEKAEERKVRTTTKVVIPDITAQIFWLKNRCPDKWRDKPAAEPESNALSQARELLGSIPSAIHEDKEDA